jgi:hypothetical protein
VRMSSRAYVISRVMMAVLHERAPPASSFAVCRSRGVGPHPFAPCRCPPEGRPSLASHGPSGSPRVCIRASVLARLPSCSRGPPALPRGVWSCRPRPSPRSCAGALAIAGALFVPLGSVGSLCACGAPLMRRWWVVVIRGNVCRARAMLLTPPRSPGHSSLCPPSRLRRGRLCVVWAVTPSPLGPHSCLGSCSRS